MRTITKVCTILAIGLSLQACTSQRASVDNYPRSDTYSSISSEALTSAPVIYSQHFGPTIVYAYSDAFGPELQNDHHNDNAPSYDIVLYNETHGPRFVNARNDMPVADTLATEVQMTASTISAECTHFSSDSDTFSNETSCDSSFSTASMNDGELSEHRGAFTSQFLTYSNASANVEGNVALGNFQSDNNVQGALNGNDGVVQALFNTGPNSVMQSNINININIYN